MREDDYLIELYIANSATSDPLQRNEPVLKRTGTPVWVVAGYCVRACSGSVALAAQDYAVTEDEVQAALAYARQHQDLDVCREEEGDRVPTSLPGRMHSHPAHGTASAA
jgi:uncharacterized protein (DUF433 family)